MESHNKNIYAAYKASIVSSERSDPDELRHWKHIKHDAMSDDEYLEHYGVKGMKWGIRRYQNVDGSLTSEGRKQARREYKEDNKNAYDLGRSATIYGRAAAKSMKRTIRYENKVDKSYEKDSSGNSRRTKFWRKRWDASAATTAQLSEMYRLKRDAAEKHCQGLINKYGKEAVKSIKYKDIKLPNGEYSPESIKTINERTNNLSDYARNGAISVGSSAFAYTMGLPVAILFRPSTTGEKAYRLENNVYAMNWREQNRKK